MNRYALLVYGGICYGAFLLTLIALARFVSDPRWPHGIDAGPVPAWPTALAVDLALIALFGLQHSGMSRAAFKRWLSRWMPAAAERSSYVLASSVVLLLLIWQWRPLPAVVWHIEAPMGRFALVALAHAGWLLALVSTFLTSHSDLLGLRQVYLHALGRQYQPVPLRASSLYRLVRHPMMTGLLIAFWSTWHMSVGHVVFAAGMTVYILIGIAFEERELLRQHGETYRAYRARVPKLIPSLRHAVAGLRQDRAGATALKK